MDTTEWSDFNAHGLGGLKAIMCAIVGLAVIIGLIACIYVLLRRRRRRRNLYQPLRMEDVAQGRGMPRRARGAV